MPYSVINWGAFTPLPYDGTDLAAIHAAIAAGHPSEADISAYWQNGIKAARVLHDVYDPTSEHPERFKRLDATVAERQEQWASATDALERFMVADRLTYSMGVAYDVYREKMGDHVAVTELLGDGARVIGHSIGTVAGEVVGGIVGGAVTPIAKAIPWWVWAGAVVALGAVVSVGVIATVK